MIKINPDARPLLGRRRGVIRLQLRTSGCCEPTVAAYWDQRRPDDLEARLDELSLVVDPETFRITGSITVSPGGTADPPSLRLETANPISEWFGLADTVIEGLKPD